jgi:hypothetical protein
VQTSRHAVHAVRSARSTACNTDATFLQVTWMVCRKFQFQAFNFVNEKGIGTLKPQEAVKISPATAYVVSDHLAQLLITDGMCREGTKLSVHLQKLLTATLYCLASKYMLYPQRQASDQIDILRSVQMPCRLQRVNCGIRKCSMEAACHHLHSIRSLGSS